MQAFLKLLISVAIKELLPRLVKWINGKFSSVRNKVRTKKTDKEQAQRIKDAKTKKDRVDAFNSLD